MESGVNALTRSERGEMRVRILRKVDPACQSVPPPSTLEHFPDIEEALARFWDQDPIVLGYLKSNIGKYQNPHSQQVADTLMGIELVDLLWHLC